MIAVSRLRNFGQTKFVKAIDRKLLFHLVDIVWADAMEDESVPSTAHARELIQKAIERRRGEKYAKTTKGIQ